MTVKRLDRCRIKRHNRFRHIMNILYIKDKLHKNSRARLDLAARCPHRPCAVTTARRKRHIRSKTTRLHLDRLQYRRIVRKCHRKPIRRNSHRVIHRNNHLDIRLGKRTRIIQPHTRTELHIHSIRRHGFMHCRR